MENHTAYMYIYIHAALMENHTAYMYIYIHAALSLSLASTYLSQLSGKGVLSPLSLQQNGFKLKIISNY